MPVAVMTPTHGRTRGPSDDRASAIDPGTRELATGSTVTLLPLAAKGDRRAVEIRIERMRPYLKRLGHGRLPHWARSRAETEDLVQESLMRALNHLPRFENQSLKDFRSWLHTVFRNLVTDEKRFVGRVGVPQEPQPTSRTPPCRRRSRRSSRRRPACSSGRSRVSSQESVCLSSTASSTATRSGSSPTSPRPMPPA